MALMPLVMVKACGLTIKNISSNTSMIRGNTNPVFPQINFRNIFNFDLALICKFSISAV